MAPKSSLCPALCRAFAAPKELRPRGRDKPGQDDEQDSGMTVSLTYFMTKLTKRHL